MGKKRSEPEYFEHLGLEVPCPECLANEDVGALDPRCPACKGTGYVPTPRGEELMRFLTREGITPGVPATAPSGHPSEDPKAPPHTPPPTKALFRDGDTTTFRGRTVHIGSANYQWDAEPRGWVYNLVGVPGLVSEAELAGGKENEPAEGREPDAGEDKP